MINNPIASTSPDSETILIVEDNDVLRGGLEEMLSGAGFTVLSAINGQDALRTMAATEPGLIVSDVNMPVMNGYEFFNAVRSHSKWVPIPFIFLTARNKTQDLEISRNLGADDFLTKPISREELVSIIRSRLARSRQIRVAQLQLAYQASMTTLANAIDMRDPFTAGHVERVTAYSLLLADYLGWPEKRIENLRYGAILHDIGKIHIPEEIIFKNSPLSHAEWEEIKRHPVNGAEMIKGIPYLSPALPIVHYHHERWDGTGYPDGLSGKSIPEGARIVAVADAFDAMTTRRPYSEARNPQLAYDELLMLAGEYYDPVIVLAFKRAWEVGTVQEIFEKRIKPLYQ